MRKKLALILAGLFLLSMFVGIIKIPEVHAQTTAVTSTSFLSISGGTQGKTFYVQRESLELKELCYR